MQEFTEEELNRIFSWRPYRQDWPVDRNQKEDNISNLCTDCRVRTDKVSQNLKILVMGAI